MPMSYQRYRGFTLVEMSIVLVIIGLILGGVMGGQALVRSARLNSVVTDITKFKAYLNTFRLQYDAMPGDMKNAYDYWGVALGCTNELATSGGTGCNGDGNGRIIWNTEGFRAWQHLTASGIMPGNYTGTATADEIVIGTNVPASRVDGGGYIFFDNKTIYGKLMKTDIAFASGSTLLNSIVTSSEAQSIDKKMDDGLAAYGGVFAFNGADTTGCITFTTEFELPSTYNLTTTNISCRMYFDLDD